MIDPLATPLFQEFQINTTTDNEQSQSSVAGLNNGRAMVAFKDTSVDPGGDIRANLVTSAGGHGTDFPVATGGNPDSEPDVAALDDGGAVVAWTRNFTGDDVDIRAQRLAPNGTPRGVLISVESSADTSRTPTVIGLANGTFVVAWQEEPAGSDSQSIWMKRYRANGPSSPRAGFRSTAPHLSTRTSRASPFPTGASSWRMPTTAGASTALRSRQESSTPTAARARSTCWQTAG